MIYLLQNYKRIIALGTAFFLVACGSPATREDIALDVDDFGKQTPYIIKVQTEVLSSTRLHGMDIPNKRLISNEDFKSSLEEAIVRSRLFKAVINGTGREDYFLTVNITHVSRPGPGSDMTADVEAIWILERVKDRKVIFKKAVLSTATVEWNEAFNGGTRINLAIARAARENIRQGLTAIAKAGL